MKIWIAKDNTSAALTTIFTGSKPVLDSEGFWWQPNEGNCQSLYDFMFPDIKKGECKEFLINDIYLSCHLDTFVEKVYD